MNMRTIPIVLLILLITSFFAGDVLSCCKGSTAAEQEYNVCNVLTYDGTDEVATESDFNSRDVNQYVPPVIPAFVKDLMENADWLTDTICVVNDKAYYIAYEDFCRTKLIYNDDRILISDPTLRVDSFTSGSKTKFCVSVADKCRLVDFSDAQSLRKMASLTRQLPSFTRYRNDSLAGFGRTVFYSFTADFPMASVSHADEIRKWLVDKIADSQSMDEDVPPLNAIYIGYTKRPNRGWKYRGDLHNHHQIAKFASSLYFAIKKGEYGTNDEDYPTYLFSTLSLQARVMNNRFVTYQLYTHDYNGGAHGYYTEKLVSYDHVHKQEIDYKYLFKPESEKELLNILLEEAKETYQYSYWNPQITESVVDVDENGNPTGGYTFPRPGLSDEGVVFSFQPYDIDCFAAGTFHFTIPYKRVRHLLTPRGKWCVGFDRKK